LSKGAPVPSGAPFLSRQRVAFTSGRSIVLRVFDLPTGALIFSLAVAAVFLGLWIYYDRRDHARFEVERRHTSFHCIRCDHVYAHPGHTDTGICPRCGHENGRLRF
jgi:uncharacterized paraquat-inducible protein A